jgi:hypothetical protein
MERKVQQETKKGKDEEKRKRSQCQKHEKMGMGGCFELIIYTLLLQYPSAL